jgi:transglutaminase-like putative cysteine protease
MKLPSLASTAFLIMPVFTATAASPVVESRTVRLTQTVTLSEIPADAKSVRLWVPIPSDGAWQRVTDRQVESAPGNWKLVRQADGRGDFVYVELDSPKSDAASVVVSCTLERQGVQFPADELIAVSSLQDELFADSLDAQAPLMAVDPQVQAMADTICGSERDPARQAALLMRAVAAQADHYSKDLTKPKCGRGSAEDCLDHGGGCCTDLHALFIALARARGVPARIEFGYRMLDSKAGQTVDPGYRCWVEYFVPGTGWVPTDIVASDGHPDQSSPTLWGSLSSTRVWLWSGRSFELTPRAAAGPIHTMICGWAEIDGVAVDPLPDASGTPSRLGRTIRFDVIASDHNETIPKLPE